MTRTPAPLTSVTLVAVALAVACTGERDRRGPVGGTDGGTAGTDGGGTATDGGTAGTDGGGSPGGGQVGDPCTSAADCTELPDLDCFTTVGGGMFPTYEFPNGFCSKGCDPGGPSDQCGETAACASSSSSGGGGGTSFSYCSPPCSADGECRSDEGYRCMIIFGGFGYCAPPG